MAEIDGVIANVAGFDKAEETWHLGWHIARQWAVDRIVRQRTWWVSLC